MNLLPPFVGFVLRHYLGITSTRLFGVFSSFKLLLFSLLVWRRQRMLQLCLRSSFKIFIDIIYIHYHIDILYILYWTHRLLSSVSLDVGSPLHVASTLKKSDKSCNLKMAGNNFLAPVNSWLRASNLKQGSCLFNCKCL